MSGWVGAPARKDDRREETGRPKRKEHAFEFAYRGTIVQHARSIDLTSRAKFSRSVINFFLPPLLLNPPAGRFRI